MLLILEDFQKDNSSKLSRFGIFSINRQSWQYNPCKPSINGISMRLGQSEQVNRFKDGIFEISVRSGQSLHLNFSNPRSKGIDVNEMHELQSKIFNVLKTSG